MRLTFIGTGYVGLTDAVGFASFGHDVLCVDLQKEKIEKIQKGQAPIFEEGLDQLLSSVIASKKLKATTSISEGVLHGEIIFIAVGTPSKEDESIDLSYIEQASKQLGRELEKHSEFKVIVVKSTVLPGTTSGLVKKNIEAYSGKTAGKDFGLAMCPEFFREGNALEDFFKPDRTVIGADDPRTREILQSLHSHFKCPNLSVDSKTAEMIKYASNTFLASRVSLINEIGNVCRKLGIDIYDVAKGVGLDSRIGSKFLNAGRGFGGSCFPKDVKALRHLAKSIGHDPRIMDAILHVNDHQPKKIVQILKEKTALQGTPVTVLGLSFKSGTDDIRDSRALIILQELLNEGAKVTVYDPKAMHHVKNIYQNKINYAQDLQEAIKTSDHIVVATDWSEFKDESLYEGKVLVDGCKIFPRKSNGIDYEGVCW